MRRRLLIARALVHRPRLVLLDEPTVGLDPQVRQELWALIDALRSEGTTILMSTHYIEEAQRLADTVMIMSHGKAVAAGPPAELVLRARRAGGARGLRAAGAARRGRGGGRRRRPAHATHRHERRRSSASTAATGSRSTASGGRRTSRTCSSCSPARRSADGGRERSASAAARPARALGAHGRARARGRQLLVLLAVGDVLLDGRADDLPARVRVRLRLARQHCRRLRLRRVRRHGDGRDGRALLERVPGDVRDVRQVPVPAHVRRDPGRARRHGGARDRGGALDRDARRRLRLRAACSWRWSSGSTRPGGCSPCRSSLGSPASAGRASGSPSRASRSRSRTSATSSAPC